MKRGPSVLLVPAMAVALTAAQAMAQTTFTVTGVCCTSYDIDGQPNPTLTVVRGHTYSFNLISCAFHPFNIQSTAGIGGTPYPHVDNNGGTDGTVTLTVPIDESADTLYYQCGNHVPMNGIINVVNAPPSGGTTTPTPTPTPTLTPPVTPTPTTTPAPIGCVGDCNDDGSVTVAELLTMVNIALGDVSLSECPAGDANGDTQVTVDEILIAVNNALSGCGHA